MKDTLEFFIKRKEQFGEEALNLKNKSRTISINRVLIVALGIVAVVIAANNGKSALLFLALFATVVIFGLLLRAHAKVRKELFIKSALQKVNEDEMARNQLKLDGLPEGMEFYQAKHPYHEDLDIFGRHSLFQLVNRCSTPEGTRLLANWLSNKGTLNEIELRQEATKELTPQVDFRQNFEAQGHEDSKTEKGSKETFFKWLNTNTPIKHQFLLKLAVLIMPIATLVVTILTLMGLAESGLLILMVFFNAFILATVLKPLQEITRETENGYKSIGSLKEHLLLIEQGTFNSVMTSELKSQIVTSEHTASQSLSELKFLLDTLHNRANMMYVVFDMLFLLDVYWYLRINKWKQSNHIEIQKWYEVVAEFDTLNSLAGFSFANDSYRYPEVSNTPFYINALSMGHPLINASKRVSNDFEFEGKGGICLITGSNMSGKSTFLRTLGVNVVLAQMGAPVCATSFNLGLVRLFTSMRTTDELEESVSSFYAELKRLKQLIDSINDKEPTLFMIDEVLKGTNSDDRHKGAHALIKQLNQTNAFGLISTHDLVLGNITNELNGVKNYSFNSIIEGDKITFDYTLTEGICKSFNATQLMKNMGIQIIE